MYEWKNLSVRGLRIVLQLAAGTVHAGGFTSNLYNIQGWLYIGINSRKSQLHERTRKA